MQSFIEALHTLSDCIWEHILNPLHTSAVIYYYLKYHMIKVKAINVCKYHYKTQQKIMQELEQMMD